MTDEIRNILKPSRTFSDEYVKELYGHAQKKKVSEWNFVSFLIDKGEVSLAVDWLRQQGDKKLRDLAEVLPEHLKKLKAEETTPTPPVVNLSISKNEKDVRQQYQYGSNSTVVNL